MKKYVLFLMITAALWGTLPQRVEAREIKDLFIAMPDSLMPMLDDNARKDLVDICLSKMKTSLPNEWNGTSSILHLTANSLQLREDSEGVITTDMAMLVKGKDTLICLVRTLHTPLPISEVQFYSADWHEQNAAKRIKTPAFSEFPHNKTNLTEGILPVEMMQAKLNITEQGAAKMTFSSNLSDHIITFLWNGKKFVREKELKSKRSKK